MGNVQIITGNQAAAIGVKLSQVQVISAYPITPQTPLTETISQLVEGGELKAEYVRVESEHSVLAVCISASSVGARVFTSTSSHGLLYMHEQLHWAAGSRLPIVMCCVNRGVGAPWSIFNDQQDSVAQRDTGWVQIYCRDNQEIIDTVIQAYRIAETVYVPVMVCYDGFVLSHTIMPVEVPDADLVRDFLPPYKPHTILEPADPRNINPVIFPWRRMDAEGVLCDGYMELRYKLQKAFEGAREVIVNTNCAYAEVFGRDYGGMLWRYRADDADVILVAMGSLASEATVAVDILREQGLKAGVVGIRVFRPFPKEEVREVFKNTGAILVFEKAISYGYEGALCSDLKAAFYGTGTKVPIHNYIVGLGGRDVKASELAEATLSSLEAIASGTTEPETQWLNCDTYLPGSGIRGQESGVRSQGLGVRSQESGGEMPDKLFKVNREEYMLPGNRSCQGCGLSLAYRYLLKALRENTILTIPASCLTVLHGLYPTTSVAIPCLNCTFPSTAASASGIVAGLNALNRTDITVVAVAGDGGTYDIGIQAISGAAERETDFIFVCYDNEAYMNTGTQRSSATPMGALTTTTPILTKQQNKKDMLKIMEAHDLPYLASTSSAFPIDLYDKFVRAKRIKGTRYIQISAPCPPGWIYPPKDTVKIGRLAVETGIVVLFEIEDGKFRFTGRSKTLAEKGNRLPVINYLERQGRFRKMSIEQLTQFQRWVDTRWNEYLRRAE